MKIRDKLNRTAAFDILSDMNRCMRNPAAGVNVCIFNAFGNTADQRKERCAQYSGNCSMCIAALLNEEG